MSPLVETPDPAQVQRRADRRAASAAHDKLAAKLQALGQLVGLTTLQISQASFERGADGFWEPATNAQHWEAYELAARLEATLPHHAGAALHERAQLVMFLLDPGGAARLTNELRRARALLA